MLDRPFDPATRIVSRRDAPATIEAECDICVVGSGASGASAPPSARRMAGPADFSRPHFNRPGAH